MRTLIDIQPEKLKIIAVLCEQYHMSRAELIRRSIDLFLETHAPTTAEAFGLLKKKNHTIDGVQYQRNLRSEWDLSVKSQFQGGG